MQRAAAALAEVIRDELATPQTDPTTTGALEPVALDDPGDPRPACWSSSAAATTAATPSTPPRR